MNSSGSNDPSHPSICFYITIPGWSTSCTGPRLQRRGEEGQCLGEEGPVRRGIGGRQPPEDVHGLVRGGDRLVVLASHRQPQPGPVGARCWRTQVPPGPTRAGRADILGQQNAIHPPDRLQISGKDDDRIIIGVENQGVWDLLIGRKDPDPTVYYRGAGGSPIVAEREPLGAYLLLFSLTEAAVTSPITAHTVLDNQQLEHFTGHDIPVPLRPLAVPADPTQALRRARARRSHSRPARRRHPRLCRCPSAGQARAPLAIGPLPGAGSTADGRNCSMASSTVTIGWFNRRPRHVYLKVHTRTSTLPSQQCAWEA
jgi:hypothetical protein